MQSAQIQKGMDLYSESVITSVDWDAAVLVTDESRSGVDADSRRLCVQRGVCVTHTDKIEANLSKCPSVMGICRESLQIQIRQDSTYWAERITSISWFHSEINGVIIQAIADEGIASAETSDQASDSC
jgi:hypothetical protein